MSENDWLREIKVGDEVIVHSNGWLQKGYRLCRVEEVTASGKIFVGGEAFCRDGRQYGQTRNWAWLLQPTDENIKLVVESSFKRFLKELIDEKTSLDFESKKAIVKIIEGRNEI